MRTKSKGSAGIDSLVKSLDPKQWPISEAELGSLIHQIASARGMEDIERISKSFSLTHEPAFLERLCLASPRAPGPFREVVRLLWTAAENMASPKPPKKLRAEYARFTQLLCAERSGSAKPVRDDWLELGLSMAGHKDFEDGDEYFQLEVLGKTAEGLLEKFQSTRQLGDLDRAVRLLGEATSKSRTGSPSFTRAATYGGLGLLQKYEITRKQSDLEASILVLRHAVANHENYLPPLLPQSGLGLLRAYIYQFQTGKDAEPLANALDLFPYVLARSADELDPEKLPQVVFVFNQLFAGLAASDNLDGLQSLAESVEQIVNASLNLQSQPYFMYQLSQILNELYKRQGNLAVLNRSITYLSNATAAGGFTLSLCLGELGLAYKMRYHATGDGGDIERSVETHRRAVESLSTQSPAYPLELDHYGLALRDSFGVIHDAARLDSAVEMAERAGTLVAENDPERLMIMGNLANNLMSRGRQLQRSEDLDRALAVVDDALSQSTDESDRRFLSTARLNILLARVEMTNRDADLQEAKRVWTEQASRPASARDRFERGSNWCHVMFVAARHEEVVDGFEFARDSARELIFLLETSEQGKATWIRQFQWLILMVAYSLARLGRIPDAVCEIEAGVALLLQESSWIRPGVMERLKEAGVNDLRARVENAARQIQYLSGAGASRFSEIRAARDAYQKALTEIQAAPGFKAFQGRVAFHQVTDALPDDTLAAYVLTTRHGALAILAGRKGAEALWFDGFTETDAGVINYGREVAASPTRRNFAPDEVGGWLGAYWQWREALPSGDQPAIDTALLIWQEQLDRTTRNINDGFIARLADAARASGANEIVFIPLMTLSWWPLHAAWGFADTTTPGDRVLPLDSVSVSYVPSVVICSDLVGTKVRNPRRSILAVGSPDPSPLTGLQGAASEAELVIEGFAETKLLLGPDATLEAFLEGASRAGIWHFAGHAYFRTGNEAALIFAHGELLRLEEIGRMKIKAPALVVLSACESGVFDIELADERRSLGTAFLEMGTSNVISTLWPVDDRASLLFIAYFYDVLRDTGAARALAATQHWMRGTTDGEKKKWVRARMERSEPKSRARDRLRWLYRDLALREEGERYYMQAYFWAGYQVQGLPEQWL